jgi:nucleoside-diphosphate-sugar epimerase
VKALVTGATGFIGSHLVEALLSRGCQVRCLVRKPCDLGWLEKKRSYLDTVNGDIADIASIRRAVAGADCVYHLAALTRAATARDIFRANTEGTRLMIEACLEKPGSSLRLVYLSSLAAVGPRADATPLGEETTPRPVSAYGWSKLRGEKEVIAAQGRIHVTILRPPIVYGPRDKGFVRYARWIKRGLLPMPAGPPRTLSFLYVDDLVHALVAASEGERPSGEVFHVAGDRVLTWEDLGGILGPLMDVRPRPLRLPTSVLLSLATCSEVWSWVTRRPTFFTRGKVREAAGHWVCDATKAKRDLGFTARMSPEEGMALAIQWYRSKGWV